MPLVLGSSSCCDICAEDYSCDDPAFTPLAIDCGHIFCRTCIGGFAPKICPNCRKPFSIGRKLHVDPPDNGAPVQSAINARSSLLLKRVALAFNGGSGRDAVINEVNNWLSAQSETSHDLNMYRPLRAALDALYKQQSTLNAADDLATLQAVENSLRMQLQEERQLMGELNDKLQMDLKNAREDLQAERDRFFAGIWIEKEASAVVQQELRDSLREATDNIDILRGENARLRSLLHEFETSGKFKVNNPVRAGTAHEPLIYDQHFQRPPNVLPSDSLRPFHAARSVVELSGTLQHSLPSSQQLVSHPMPYGNLGSKSVDNIRGDRKAKKAKVNSSDNALATNRKPQHQSGISPKPCDKNKSSVDTSGDQRLQGGHNVLTSQPQNNFLTTDPQYFQHNKSTTTPVATSVSKPRRILKMASSPLLRKTEDGNIQTDKRGPSTDSLARRQAGHHVRLQKARAPNDPMFINHWESNTTLAGGQANSNGTKGMKKSMRHCWFHGWKLFHSGGI